jgi:hypothetical protein
LPSFGDIANRRSKKKSRKNRVSNQDRWILKLIDDATDGGFFTTPRGKVFYPSALGNPCDRALYNDYNAVPRNDPITPQTQRKFNYGHDLEDRVDKYLHKMGVVQARELVVKSEDPPISGRIDFIVKHPKEGLAVVELKSIHDSGWSALIDKPKPEHFVQIQLYMNMQGIDYGIVLYEDKNDQTYKAFKLTVDRQFWTDIKARCHRIMSMNAPPVNCTGERYCRCGGKRT